MTADTTIQTRILHGLGDTCLLIGELAGQLELTNGQVSDAAAGLIGRGLVERIDRGCFQLTEAGRAARDSGIVIETGVTGPTRAPRRMKGSSVRQRAWNVMRIVRTFAVPDLVMTVMRPGDADATKNLQHYLHALLSAGYVARTGRRRPGTAPGSNGFPVYSLIRDTGPAAPVVSTRSGLIDFNGGAPCARR